ncbi:MAG: patatin-like phospholipase family protein [Flavobacteriales bacterium]|nr:patatin-like phospholipase family protein [Flavobacteriales bacterium]
MSTSKPFRVGLCLAGAVSAGAYTAGVMDYLFEALEEWERRKRDDPTRTPKHQVEIPVIGGASAGGMTGIITAASLYGVLPPVRWKDGDFVLAQRPENKLYHSWVDLTHDDMFPELLGTGDIGGKQTRSLLNADFIDRIAERAVQVDQPWRSRPYINDRLLVFTTLTNLEGLHFDITFNADNESAKSYYIGIHNDYACFELNITDAQYGGRGWMPLDFHSRTNTTLARDAAMATGAFPVGLRARSLERPERYVNDMPWLAEVTSLNPVVRHPYTTVNVDGGLINNEPFERVREVLNDLEKREKGEAWSAADFDDYDRTGSTVLMIDPFPSALEKFDPGDGLRNVAMNTLGAMMGQLRIKPAALVDALHSDKAGQYVIAPGRKLPDTVAGGKEVMGAEAIACGSLGGFGGFLHKEFRVHDYFLGRANCEKFLRDQFTIRLHEGGVIANPILKAGYEGIPLTDFLSRTDKEPGGVQIIPLFTKQAEHMPLPKFRSGHNWPMRTEADIDRFRSLLKDRADAIVSDQVNTNWWQGGLLWIGRKVLLNGKVADAVLNIIKKSLRKSNLLE